MSGSFHRATNKTAMFMPVRPMVVIAGLVAIGQICHPALADDADGSGLSFSQATILSPDARFVTWDSKQSTTGQRTSSGHQVYVPLGVQTTLANESMKLELLARSGYVWTRNNVYSAEEPKRFGEIETLTDTSLSATASFFHIAGIQPYVQMAVNLPTGETVLRGDQRLAMVDSDLVQLAAFGSGVNVAPTLGANIPLSETVVATVSLGYNKRGRFDRSVPGDNGIQALAEIDPGDTWTAGLGIRFQKDALSGSLNGSIIDESKTTFDHNPYSRNGLGTILTGGLGYAWSPGWSSDLNVSWMHFKRNHVLNGELNDLIPERFNSNNHLATVRLSTTYTDGPWSITPAGGFIWREQNDWDPATFQFVPSKRIWSAGLSARFDLTDMVAITASAERSWLYEFENPPKSGGGGLGDSPPIDSDVWLFTLGGSARF